MAKRNKKADKNAEPQLPKDPLDRIAHIESYLLSMAGQGQLPYSTAMPQLREALDEAARKNVWSLVDAAFSRLVRVSFELLTRASVELRCALDQQDGRIGAPERPALAATAEKVQRIALFLFESTEKYSKSQHVVAIARRADNAKILSLVAARRNAKKKKHKKTSRKAAAGGRE